MTGIQSSFLLPMNFDSKAKLLNFTEYLYKKTFCWKDCISSNSSTDCLETRFSALQLDTYPKTYAFKNDSYINLEDVIEWFKVPLCGYFNFSSIKLQKYNQLGKRTSIDKMATMYSHFMRPFLY